MNISWTCFIQDFWNGEAGYADDFQRPSCICMFYEEQLVLKWAFYIFRDLSRGFLGMLVIKNRIILLFWWRMDLQVSQDPEVPLNNTWGFLDLEALAVHTEI